MKAESTEIQNQKPIMSINGNPMYDFEEQSGEVLLLTDAYEQLDNAHAIDKNLDCGILTSKQVAKYLQMSPRTVYSHWEKLGGLKIGRTLRFRKENIDALFREETKKMERSGQKRKRKIHASISDKDRGKKLGSRKVEGTGKPEAGNNRNRHGLLDDQ